jgi:hypothetical protein
VLRFGLYYSTEHRGTSEQLNGTRQEQLDFTSSKKEDANGEHYPNTVYLEKLQSFARPM